MDSKEYTFLTEKINTSVRELKTPKPEKFKEDGCLLVACGSYNPITFMHLRILEDAKNRFNDLGIPVFGGVVSPVNAGYTKQGLVEPVHRLTMCQLAVESSDWIFVDKWEIVQDAYQRTRVVLDHIKKQVNTLCPTKGGIRTVFLCGADVLESFLRPGVWSEEDMHIILSEHGVAVCERQGLDLEKLINDNELLRSKAENIFIVPCQVQNNVSSTKVRELVKRNRSTKYLVSDSVISYVEQNGLYK